MVILKCVMDTVVVSVVNDVDVVDTVCVGVVAGEDEEEGTWRPVCRVHDIWVWMEIDAQVSMGNDVQVSMGNDVQVSMGSNEWSSDSVYGCGTCGLNSV